MGLLATRQPPFSRYTAVQQLLRHRPYPCAHRVIGEGLLPDHAAGILCEVRVPVVVHGVALEEPMPDALFFLTAGSTDCLVA